MPWLNRTEMPVLLVLLALAIMMQLFIALADEVSEGDTQRFDEWMVRALRDPEYPSLPRGPQWLRSAGHDITAMGGPAVLTLVTLIAAGYLWLQRQRRAMCLMLLAVGSSVLVSKGLKLYFGRERPESARQLLDVLTYSFPSGHSMLSAVVYLVLATMLARMESRRLIKFYILAVGVLLTVLIGASRVYLGVHYPTDVLAGWTAGLTWALVWWLIARYLQNRGAVEASAGAEASARQSCG